MKQLVIAFLKCMSFFFFLRAIQTVTLNRYLWQHNDFQYILFVLIDAIISLLFFYALLFKTETLVNLFKIKWESTESVAYPVVLKSGIFLIGFYFFASTIGGVMSDIFLYLKKELSTTNGSTFNRLTELNTHVTFDSILTNFITASVGFLIASNADRITSYFLKKDKSVNENS